MNFLTKIRLNLFSKLFILLALIFFTPTIIFGIFTYPKILSTKNKILALKVEDSTEIILKKAKKNIKEIYNEVIDDFIISMFFSLFIMLTIITLIYFKFLIPLRQTVELLKTLGNLDEKNNSDFLEDEINFTREKVQFLIQNKPSCNQEEKINAGLLNALDELKEKILTASEGNFNFDLTTSDGPFSEINNGFIKLLEKFKISLVSLRKASFLAKSSLEFLDKMIQNVLKITEKEGIELDIFNIEISNISKTFTTELSQLIKNYRNIKTLEKKLTRTKISSPDSNFNLIFDRFETIISNTLSKVSNFSDNLANILNSQKSQLNLISSNSTDTDSSILESSIKKSMSEIKDLLIDCNTISSDYLKLVDFINQQKGSSSLTKGMSEEINLIQENIKNFIEKEGENIKSLFRTSKKNFLLFNETISTIKKLYKKAEEKSLSSIEAKQKVKVLKELISQLHEFTNTFVLSDEHPESYQEKSSKESSINLITPEELTENSGIKIFSEEEFKESSIKSQDSDLLLTDKSVVEFSSNIKNDRRKISVVDEQNTKILKTGEDKKTEIPANLKSKSKL